jgi:hypothetical protein
MATPSSGQIGISDIIANDGANIGYGNNLNWLKTNSKDGAADMNSAHAREAYQRYMDGNCNNGNCTQSDCNCGNINCPNCLNCNAIDCAACDTREWFQANCNSASTPVYNCTQNTRSYNCNCDCFVCACACW